MVFGMAKYLLSYGVRTSAGKEVLNNPGKSKKHTMETLKKGEVP